MQIEYSPGYELKDELARLCLPSANRDRDRKLAWVNSVCILFLLIGVLGARRGVIAIKPVPPIRKSFPSSSSRRCCRRSRSPQKRQPEQQIRRRAVVVALPHAPNINFGVPTVGTLVARQLAAAPPLEPHAGRGPDSFARQHRRGRRTARTALSAHRPARRRTGHGDAFPQRRRGGQCHFRGREGIVRFSRPGPGAVDFIKRHWRLPTGHGTRLFETSITYQLQLN